MVETGVFFRVEPARAQAARLRALGARVETQGAGRAATHRVVIGPLPDLAAADHVIAGAIAAGLPELRLLVE
jgi:hypothetical protein